MTLGVGVGVGAGTPPSAHLWAGPGQRTQEGPPEVSQEGHGQCTRPRRLPGGAETPTPTEPWGPCLSWEPPEWPPAANTHTRTVLTGARPQGTAPGAGARAQGPCTGALGPAPGAVPGRHPQPSPGGPGEPGAGSTGQATPPGSCLQDASVGHAKAPRATSAGRRVLVGGRHPSRGRGDSGARLGPWVTPGKRTLQQRWLAGLVLGGLSWGCCRVWGTEGEPRAPTARRSRLGPQQPGPSPPDCPSPSLSPCLSKLEKRSLLPERGSLGRGASSDEEDGFASPELKRRGASVDDFLKGSELGKPVSLAARARDWGPGKEARPACTRTGHNSTLQQDSLSRTIARPEKEASPTALP